MEHFDKQPKYPVLYESYVNALLLMDLLYHIIADQQILLNKYKVESMFKTNLIEQLTTILKEKGIVVRLLK